jgi:hypothetical protein
MRWPVAARTALHSKVWQVDRGNFGVPPGGMGEPPIVAIALALSKAPPRRHGIDSRRQTDRSVYVK